jgi:hypothetical protein
MHGGIVSQFSPEKAENSQKPGAIAGTFANFYDNPVF